MSLLLSFWRCRGASGVRTAYGLAALAGVTHAAALAWPFSGEPLWWLSLLSQALFAAVLLSAQRPGCFLSTSPSAAIRKIGISPTEQLAQAWHQRPVVQGALLGLVFAAAWLSGTFWWLFISLHTYGGLHPVLSVAAVLGLALFLSVYYAVAAALWVRVRSRNWVATALVFAALWMMAELARGTWLTGFPWGASGYAHVQGPLSILPRYVGVYGTGAVAAFMAMLLAQFGRALWDHGFRAVAQAASRRLRGIAAVVCVLLTLWGAAFALRWCDVYACSTPVSHAPGFSVALLQGNIPQDEKFQPGSGVPMALAWYAQAIEAAPASLVVAPETAIPLLPAQLHPRYLEQLTQDFVKPDSQRALLLGLPLGNMQAGYTNSVWGFAAGTVLPTTPNEALEQPGAPPYQYDKHHLVPFGEFIPPLFRWFTEMLHIPLGDFNRGAVGQPSFAWAGERIAPNICYEDLFGEEIAARFLSPDLAPTVLMNFSNIGWFGDSLAIDQHLQISRMRALEFERPMVRATNTGATVVIDHRGVVTHALPRLTRGVLLAQVQGRGGKNQLGVWRTPYAAWAAHWGLLPLWLWGVVTVLSACVALRYRKADDAQIG